MKFKILRSSRRGQSGHYETYEVPTGPGMTVLDALFKIQETHDGSLAFRYSCRGAVCGSCAMTINREPRLACRTQVEGLTRMKPMGLSLFKGLEKAVDWDWANEILIEPLPNLPVTKDLVVDQTKFFEAYRKIKPWFEPNESETAFSKVMPDQAERIDRYLNCILCAACFGACPVCDKDPDYLGPAALAVSERFLADVRIPDKEKRLELVADKEAAPACEFIYNCVKVCPKGVAPALAIRSIRDSLETARH